ncbi:CHAD domain-containing protein, partial [Kitasatospora sp. NPDC059571]|uniref:CYTH and CHAD domain-containing protein n=1 Tax=Kitasatospora sp. NPDC059571 TaxID=3346871 RepID=UPI0036A5DEAD
TRSPRRPQSDSPRSDPPPRGRRARPPRAPRAGGRAGAGGRTARARRAATSLLDGDGRTLAEVDVDTVSADTIGPGGTASRTVDWIETEVELADAGADLLEAVGATLRGHGLRPSVPGTKLGRALQQRLAELPDRPPRGVPAGPRKVGTVGAALTAYLRAQVASLESLDAAVRLDEPDAVHRMRVTVRRLRSALAVHRRILRKGSVDHVEAELRRLGRILGRARDAEVLGARLTAQAAGLPAAARPGTVRRLLEEVFTDRYETGRQAAVRAMEQPRYFALLGALEALAADPPLRGRAERGRKEARRMLARQQKRTVRRLGAALELPPGPERDSALHRARKAAKRARYAAESAEPLLGRPAPTLGRRAKRIHKALGAHQDGVVAERAIRELAADAPPEVAFALGMLHGRQRQDADAQVKAAAKAGRRLGL